MAQIICQNEVFSNLIFKSKHIAKMDSTEDPYGFSATDAWEDQINKASSLPEGASVRHKHHAFGDVAQIR